eukprot:INCI1124.1.p1 GENE.INCI1124.1~~INCI1124.1.p1  ORF type:complete len:462 (-),score=79.38 INCI1124.1:1353-2738(-)
MNFAAAVRGKPEFVRQAVEQAKLADLATHLAVDVLVASSSPSPGNDGTSGVKRPNCPKLKNKVKDIDEKHTSHRFTALHEAAFLGHAHVVASLLDQKARVDVLDREGRTPLDLAIWHSHSECVKLLNDRMVSFATQNRRALAEAEGSGNKRLHSDHQLDAIPASPRLLAPRLLSREVAGIDLNLVAATAEAKERKARERRHQRLFKSIKQASTSASASTASTPRGTAVRDVDYQRRTLFERKPRPSELNRVNPPIDNVDHFMESSRQQLGDQSLGQSILAGFRQQRRLHVEPGAHDRAAPWLNASPATKKIGRKKSAKKKKKKIGKDSSNAPNRGKSVAPALKKKPKAAGAVASAASRSQERKYRGCTDATGGHAHAETRVRKAAPKQAASTAPKRLITTHTKSVTPTEVGSSAIASGATQSLYSSLQRRRRPGNNRLKNSSRQPGLQRLTQRAPKVAAAW